MPPPCWSQARRRSGRSRRVPSGGSSIGFGMTAARSCSRQSCRRTSCRALRRPDRTFGPTTGPTIQTAAGVTIVLMMGRRLVLGLLLAWLPLQGFAAVAMPFCRHALHTPVDASAGHRHDGAAGGTEHRGHHGTASDEAPSTGKPLTCNDCGACQLACAPAAPPAVGVAALAPTHAGVFAPEPCEPGGFIPEQPKRPPLTRG